MTKLVKAGADVRATDADREMCLILSALDGHTDTVHYLVSLPEVDLNHQDSKNYNTALHYAVRRKHADVVQVLIDAGADIETKNDDGRSPLHVASISGELTTVRMLVKAGADGCTCHRRQQRHMSHPCSESWTHRYCALSCEFAGGGPESPTVQEQDCVALCCERKTCRRGAGAH